MVLGSPGAHFIYMRVKVTFNLNRAIKQNPLPVITGCQCQGNIFISYLFLNNKFLNSLMILCSILFPNIWKFMVYYFALFCCISKYLKIDYCKLWATASYFLTCPESIFKGYKSSCFSIDTSFLTKEKAIIGSYHFMINIWKCCNKIKQHTRVYIDYI